MIDLLTTAGFDQPWQGLLLIVASFFGSAITATFSLGGGLMMITLMSIFMPVPAVVPVHGAVMLGSNVGRTVLLARHVDWQIVGWFVLGAVVGGTIGSHLVITLPEMVLRLSIALFVLYTQWGKGFGRLKFGPKGFVLAGTFSTFLTMFVGATGPFIAAILSRNENMNRMQIIGTAGASMISQHSIKVVLFALAGFAFAPWLPFIIACILSGFMGTYLGTHILKRIDEKKFRILLKWFLTALAFYLLALVGADFF